MRIRPAIVFLFALAIAVPAAAQRLPTTISPEHYDLTFSVDLANARFDGTETIRVQVADPTTRIVLNAADIEFHDVTVAAGGATQTADVATDPRLERATFTVARRIPTGAAEIHIRYTGRLNDQLRGFYLSRTKERRYAVTQFESTDARRAFPCFDEPAFKATFAVTLVVDHADTAISNGRILSDTPGPTPRRHTIKFATTPKMSSYLVAMAVGDFQCVSGGADGIPIRICATPDKKALGEIALHSAEEILHFYDGYYAIKYPFSKLDVVAVPDFAAGAMENTAAIFYRETDLLADTRSASINTRKTIAAVLAHEMAHQWFGDLVTMAWWDDIWLNEGFATWMATHPLAALHPEWNIPVDEALENQAALSLDSLQATRPIHVTVETPAEIEEAFDTITYQKGAAVLRMIESFVGAETFRTGVNAYLQAHAFGNATSQDFWTAIAQASGRPIDRIMPTFVNQPGVPLLTIADAQCEDQGHALRATLSQQRFVLGGRAPAERWLLPACTKIPGATATSCVVLDQPEQRLDIAHGCPAWFFVNAGARGYYRTDYPSTLLRALAPDVETALTGPERVSLASDEWALVRAGRHHVSDFLTLASGFGRERSSGVLSTITDRLDFIHEYLTTEATRPKVEAFVRSLLGPTFAEVGLQGANDTPDRRTLRGAVVAALGTTGDDAAVVSQARAALDRALAGGPALDPTVASAIVRVAVEHGDARLYDALSAAAARSATPEEQYRYLYALPLFRDPALIDRALDYATSPQLRSQDGPIYLSRFLVNPAARDRAWAFVKAHWAALEPKITIAQGDMVFVGALGQFCDARTRDDIKAFFTEHPLPTSARTLQQTLEQITNCVELKARETPVVTQWIASQPS